MGVLASSNGKKITANHAISFIIEKQNTPSNSYRIFYFNIGTGCEYFYTNDNKVNGFVSFNNIDIGKLKFFLLTILFNRFKDETDSTHDLHIYCLLEHCLFNLQDKTNYEQKQTPQKVYSEKEFFYDSFESKIKLYNNMKMYPQTQGNCGILATKMPFYYILATKLHHLKFDPSNERMLNYIYYVDSLISSEMIKLFIKSIYDETLGTIKPTIKQNDIEILDFLSKNLDCPNESD
jgi:hypothetical protein